MSLAFPLFVLLLLGTSLVRGVSAIIKRST
jgi:hypothetical protein